MNNPSFTLVGVEQPGWMGWMFAALVLWGLWRVRSVKHRWGGVFVASASALVWGLHLPSPVWMQVFFAALVAGSTVDRVLQRRADGQQVWGKEVFWGVAAVGVVVAMWGLVQGHQRIVLENSRIVTTARNGMTLTCDRSAIKITEFVAENGKSLEWRIERGQPGNEERFLANTISAERYRDSHGRMLAASEVAAQVARWAGVPVAVEPMQALLARDSG